MVHFFRIGIYTGFWENRINFRLRIFRLFLLLLPLIFFSFARIAALQIGQLNREKIRATRVAGFFFFELFSFFTHDLTLYKRNIYIYVLLKKKKRYYLFSSGP